MIEWQLCQCLWKKTKNTCCQMMIMDELRVAKEALGNYLWIVGHCDENVWRTNRVKTKTGGKEGIEGDRLKREQIVNTESTRIWLLNKLVKTNQVRRREQKLKQQQRKRRPRVFVHEKLEKSALKKHTNHHRVLTAPPPVFDHSALSFGNGCE